MSKAPPIRLKGAVKDTPGKSAGDPQMQAEGKTDKAKGRRPQLVMRRTRAPATR